MVNSPAEIFRPINLLELERNRHVVTASLQNDPLGMHTSALFRASMDDFLLGADWLLHFDPHTFPAKSAPESIARDFRSGAQRLCQLSREMQDSQVQRRKAIPQPLADATMAIIRAVADCIPPFDDEIRSWKRSMHEREIPLSS